MKNDYFPTVDFLRLFACLWVVSDHFFGNTGAILTPFKYGNLGVPLFFIISGFVISLSIQGRSLKEFAVVRFLRLYPLFWFACLTTFIITCIVPNGNPVSIKDLLINLTMAGTKGGASQLVDPAYWSLAVEIAFYIAIGLFVAIFSFKRIRFFYGSWLAVAFLVFYFGIESNLYAQFTLARHAPYFIFGGFLALLLQGFSDSTHREKLLDIGGMALAAGVAFYAMNYSLLPYWQQDPHDVDYVAFINLAFFLSVPFIIYGSKHIAHPAIIQYAVVAGGITYPIYLLNQKLGGMFIDYMGGDHTLSAISLVTTILVIVISYIVYIYDKKLRKVVLKKILKPKEVTTST